MKGKLTIGIDEVGRGALAGPVVVAGISLQGRFHFKTKALGSIRDSKKLSPQKREKWYRYLVSVPTLSWKISKVSPKVIDRINVTKAANLAASRTAKALLPPNAQYKAVLDAGLVLPANIKHRSIVRGDERMGIIAAASILAKVTRDRLMRRLHRKDSRYRFDIHKGYGTRLHRTAIKKFGYSDFHRKSFAVKI